MRRESHHLSEQSKIYAARKPLFLSARTVFAVLTLFFILSGFLLASSCMDAGSSKASEEYPVYKYYTSVEVTEGETLWEIADIYMDEHYSDKRTYIDEIKRLNQIDENRIQNGSCLIIPYYSEKYL